MQVDELIEKGFALLELVQAPGANITVEVLEDAGVPALEIAILRTTLVDLENGSGGSTGAIVAVVIVVLLLLVLLLLFYRHSNQKPLVVLSEDPHAHVTKNKSFENPQYSAADAGAADGDGQLHPPAGLATRGTSGSNTAVAAVRNEGVYYDADPVDAGDSSSVVYAVPLDDDNGADAQALYRPVYDSSMLAPIQDADLYDDGTPVPDGSAAPSSSAIYVAMGNGDSDIYRAVHGEAAGEQSGSANMQLYAVPMADNVGSGDGVGTFDLLGGRTGTVVGEASSGAREVVGTDGLYAPPPAAAAGGLRRKPSVYIGFGEDENA